MPYANLSGLTARYGQHMLVDLTDRALPPTGQIDVDVVQAALEDTDALIDGYLAGRYALPLAETPRLLSTVAEVVAIYKLHVSVVPDKIAADYRDQLKLLAAIAAGDVLLSGADGVEPAAPVATGVVYTDRDRDLTPENLRGWI